VTSPGREGEAVVCETDPSFKGEIVFAASFGDGQVAYSLLWFFLFFIEIWLEVSVFIDIFRSHDLKGWMKAIWVVLVFVFPLLGILAYFILRGDKMRAHQVVDQDAMYRQFIQRSGQGRWSKTDELSRLAELRDHGDITPDEYQRLKTEIMQDA
jgi:hypothetical protein